MSDLLLSFYGDDFTGSTDAMESLARGGVRTVLFTTPPTPAQLARYDGLRAFGVAGMTRSMSPEAMEQTLRPAFEVIRQCKPPIVHYKVCSTFDPDRYRAPMTKITYVTNSGERIETEGQNGSTVMETAIMNAVPGIVAECGGACTCATCHVYIDDDWREIVGGPSTMEEDMLDFAFDVRDSSRLSCQIKVRDALDGLVVHVPSRQG